jgi:hypothetical protein
MLFCALFTKKRIADFAILFLEYIVTYFEIKQENRYRIVKNTQK